MVTPYPITTTLHMWKHGCFLFDHTYCVRFAISVSSFFPQFKGIPQDSVFSTTLFLIAVNRLVSALLPGICSSLYIDDLTIYLWSFHTCSPSASPVCYNINLFLSYQPWILILYLQNHFHPFFGSRISSQLPLFLYDTPIQFCPSGKFLGVIFDSKLSWRDHILSFKDSYKLAQIYPGVQTAKHSSISILP